MEICSVILGTSQRSTKHEKFQKIRAICLWVLLIVIIIMCINNIAILSYVLIAGLQQKEKWIYLISKWSGML